MIVSSGGICERYEVIGIVVGFASTREGCSGGIPIEQTYDAALKRLLESANAKGATGLLFVNFQNRFASAAGCIGGKQAFEVFAWGTAVKVLQEP